MSSSNHRYAKPSDNHNNQRNYRDAYEHCYGNNGSNSDRKYYGERRYFNQSSNNYYGNYRSDYNRRENYGNDRSYRDRRSNGHNDDDINGDNSRTAYCFSVLQVKPFAETNGKTEKTSNKQLQLDEITAIKSIYDEPVLTIDDSQLKGRFVVEPKLTANPFFIIYYCREIGKISAKQVFTIEHLPPIELYFEFSDSYPSKSQPMFLLSCKWLEIYELDRICAHLEKLWRDSKSEILFKWFSFLQNDLLNWLGITRELDITGMINLEPMWRNVTDQSSNKFSIRKKSLKSRDRNFVMEFRPKFRRGQLKFDQRAVCDLLGFELINHIRCNDEDRRKQIFDTTYFMCNICFTQHSGKECVSFTCKHIHCRNCITSYFESLVKDGAVNSLKCPEIKCETQAPLNLIRELISEDLYKRFDQLKLATMVATTEDAHYCPRKLCGNVVIAESDSSLAHCECGFAFCKHCKYSYHGIDPCQLFRDDKQRKIILDKYSNANGQEKLRLEKQYGKKQLIAAINDYESEKWIDSMSKRCPHCKASIEKENGCNKMLCQRCSTYFCWLCLQHLNVNAPYSHYNDPQSKCYNLLFQGIDMNEDFDVMFI